MRPLWPGIAETCTLSAMYVSCFENKRPGRKGWWFGQKLPLYSWFEQRRDLTGFQESFNLFFFFFFCFFAFFRATLWHMEVHRPGVELEL